MWKIAQKYKIGLPELIAVNPQITNPNLIYPQQKITIPEQDEQTGAIESQVTALVNQQRIQRGLPPLEENWELSRVARYKSKDMRDLQYFSHTSPTYGSPFEMLDEFDITYSAAGENIATGQKTAQAVVDAWMNSPGHRDNILNSDYTQIGVGYAEGGNKTYWTQLFIRP